MWQEVKKIVSYILLLDHFRPNAINTFFSFSVSKTTRELQLFWSDSHEPVSIATDLKMPQFTVEKVAPTTCNEQFHLGTNHVDFAPFKSYDMIWIKDYTRSLK